MTAASLAPAASEGAAAGGSRLVPSVLLAAAIATVAADAMTPRDLSLGEDAPEWNTDPAILAFQVMRAATALLLLASAVAAVTGGIRRGLPRPGLGLWAGYAAFVLTCFVVPAFAGAVPGVDARVLYPPVVFTALYLARAVPARRFDVVCKIALAVPVHASLAAAVIAPRHALAASFEGLVPWLDFRLYGVGGGAISLGVMSSLLLCVELVAPSRPAVHRLNLAAAALALFLAQAKTSWLFALAVIGLLVLARAARRLRPWLGVAPSARAAAALVLLLGVVGAAAAGAAALGRIDAASVRGAANLSTFTGRTYVWAVTLSTWLEHPVFGYGPGLWRGEFAQRFGPLWPHAHNQFIHTLGSAGLVGLAGLLLYLGAAARAALRAARVTLVPLVLLGGLLSQCLTNVPLLGAWLVEPLVVAHLLTFAALANGEKLAAGAAAEPGAAPQAG